MSDPKMISEIQKAVTIPVMAKVRIGHFVEAEVQLFSYSLARSYFLNRFYNNFKLILSMKAKC